MGDRLEVAIAGRTARLEVSGLVAGGGGTGPGSGDGLYLADSAVASAYGAAGSLMLFLVWVYYSSLILFVGCELTVLLFHKAPPGGQPDSD